MVHASLTTRNYWTLLHKLYIRSIGSCTLYFRILTEDSCVQSKYVHGLVLSMSIVQACKYFISVVHLLYKCCTGVLQVLFKYYITTRIIQVLHNTCTSNVQELYMNIVQCTVYNKHVHWYKDQFCTFWRRFENIIKHEIIKCWCELFSIQLSHNSSCYAWITR